MSSLLFVCTANMCRSPLAAAMMRRAVASDRTVEVASAGRLPGGNRVPETGIRVGAERGLDLREHVSTQLEPALLGTADVVLTMTREQARDLVAEDVELWPRVFTVKQFARWLAENPVPAEGLSAAWLSEQASARRGLELIGADDADDVRDLIQLLGQTLPLLMYCAPVFYDRTIVPPAIQPWLSLNPFTFYAEAFHALVLGHGTLLVSSLIWALVVAALALLAGYGLFRRLDRHFEDFL